MRFNAAAELGVLAVAVVGNKPILLTCSGLDIGSDAESVNSSLPFFSNPVERIVREMVHWKSHGAWDDSDKSSFSPFTTRAIFS